MDNEQAKLTLAAYRLDGRDAQDPFFEEALRQADRDPELKRWFAGQQTFDRRMRSAIESIAPPARARSMALAAMRMSRRRKSALRWFVPLALAASIALVATTYTILGDRGSRIGLPQSASIEALAGYLAEHHASIGLMNEDYATLVAWIRNRGGPVPENLPPALASLPVLGCQTWNTDRGQVSLVCFVGPERKMLHLYVFENPGALPGPLPSRASPRVERHDAWAMASWQDGGRAYVLGMPAEGDATATLEPFVKA